MSKHKRIPIIPPQEPIPAPEPDLNLELEKVQQVVEGHFPQYWPAIKAGLATIATLLLEDNSNPATMICHGGPSTGKTTVISVFSGHSVTYHSDSFTTAAFVSNRADVPEEKLARIDLLPRIRYKCLLTPEMAPTFSGREDTLRERLAILTRVLDGQGLRTNTGAHEPRGYDGDYLFAWIGATTPFRDKVWDIMGNMGSRLLFWPMPEENLTPNEIVRANEGTPYRERVEECRKVVHSFLSHMFGSEEAIRSVVWKEETKELKGYIACLASLLSALRSKEAAFRAYAMLYNFARGHALLSGRRSLDWEDTPLTVQLAIGSIPEDRRKVFSALIRCHGYLSTEIGQELVGWGKTKAYDELRKFDGEVMEFVEKPVQHLRLRDRWAWTILLADYVGGRYEGPSLDRLLLALAPPDIKRAYERACKNAERQNDP
ncbi:MAG: hypothetical protein ACYSTI_11940 [Planctomycetota bacterium]|jgi:hypothetical protein